MGTKERLQQSVDLRKEDILAAARRVFDRKGFSNTRMEDIATEAEYTKRTLYRYFTSKDQLFLTLMLQEQKRLKDYFRDAAAKEGSGFEKVCHIGKRYVTYFHDEPESFALLNLSPGLFAVPGETEQALVSEIMQNGADVQRLIGDAFRLGITDGSVKADVDPYKATLYVMSVTTGMLQTVGRSGGHFEQFHGLSSRDFADYCLKNLGAVFATAPCKTGEEE